MKFQQLYNQDLLKFQQLEIEMRYIFFLLPLLGEFVAFTHSEWRSRPLIGKAEHITGKTTRIRWWEGSYTTVWKPSNRRQGRQTIPWVEEIPTENITLSFPWKQKEGKRPRLPLKIKDKLKELYEQ